MMHIHTRQVVVGLVILAVLVFSFALQRNGFFRIENDIVTETPDVPPQEVIDISPSGTVPTVVGEIANTDMTIDEYATFFSVPQDLIQKVQSDTTENKQQ